MSFVPTGILPLQMQQGLLWAHLSPQNRDICLLAQAICCVMPALSCLHPLVSLSCLFFFSFCCPSWCLWWSARGWQKLLLQGFMGMLSPIVAVHWKLTYVHTRTRHTHTFLWPTICYTEVRCELPPISEQHTFIVTLQAVLRLSLSTQ